MDRPGPARTLNQAARLLKRIFSFMAQFVQLHNHTEYSLLDGMLRVSENHKPSRFLQGLAQQGIPAMAMTDHGNMYATLYFAELLVLMAKQLDLRMILTTHSPYFLQAVDVFSKKHGFHQKTHFYLAKREADGAVIENIDGKLDETYNMLAEPIIRLRELYEEQLEIGT